MDAKQYQLKRDELLRLMEQVVKVDGIRDSERDSFLSTQHKLVENQFNIVLIGEFQGGKSTTFNAMCGGREISPRGAMTKTSAICMTATNLSEPSQEEYAEVRWKSNSELRDMISEVIKFVTLEDGESFDFDNTTHTGKLREQVEKMRKDGAEILRIAQLLLAFYGNSEVKNYCSRNRFKIEEIAKIAVFPSDWDDRWNNVHNINDVKQVFKVEDVLFIFVSDIQIHVHSDSLARLGCSLTDCPGLFASQFDTQIALKAMNRANAVIYLLGNKAIGESEEKSIKEVMRHTALRDKVFFALNQQKNNTVTENVINTNKSKIKNMGFGDVEITNFNSLLFFLSEFGKAKLACNLDDYSLLRFKQIAVNNGFGDVRKEDAEKQNYQNLNIEELWADIVRSCGHYTGQKDAQIVNGLDDETVSIARSVSRCDKVIGGIENNIVSKKAQSILVDSGAALIKNSLDGISARLQTEEDLANKSVEECEEAFQNALNAYNQFKSDADEILNNAIPQNVIHSIALSAFTELITDSDVVDRMANRINNDINSTLGFWDKAKLAFKTDEEKETQIKPIVEDAINNELGADITMWVQSMIRGEHDMYTGMVQPQLESVALKINNKWELFVSSNPLLQGYRVEMPSIDSPTEYVANGGLVDEIADSAIESAGNVIENIILKIVGVIVGMIVGLIIDILLTGGFLFIITAIFGGVVAGKEDRSLSKIKDSFNKKFGERDTKDAIIAGMEKCPESIFTAFKNFYSDELSTMQQNLINDIEKKRADQAESMEHQQEVAARAHRIRTEQIEPLSGQISTFITSCNC